MVLLHQFLRHHRRGGGGGSLVVVCKVVSSGEILHIPGAVIKLVSGSEVITGAPFLSVIDHFVIQSKNTLVQDGMGIAVDGDHIIPCVQDIGFSILVVVGGHILQIKGKGEGLALTRLEKIGLFKVQQVGHGLLYAAV